MINKKKNKNKKKKKIKGKIEQRQSAKIYGASAAERQGYMVRAGMQGKAKGRDARGVRWRVQD